jgi:hypothetical protein
VEREIERERERERERGRERVRARERERESNLYKDRINHTEKNHTNIYFSYANFAKNNFTRSGRER